MSLCEYLLHLYRGSREYSVARLPDWALEHTSSLVPFDSAVWTIGTGTTGMHSVHSFRLPVEFIKLWKKHAKAGSVMNATNGGGNGRSKTCTSLAPRAKDTSITGDFPPPGLCARSDIRHAMCTTVQDTFTGLYHSICFYRHGINKPFSGRERMLIEFCAPHLVEARHNNIAAHLSTHKQEGCLSGICDKRGMLHHMEPGFGDLLKIEWPEFRPPYIASGALLNHLKRRSAYEGKRVIITITSLGDLMSLQLRRQSRVCRLSSRERLITKHLMAGSTYKQIAQALDISPFTVTKHANSIYKKTGAENKTQLARKFREMKEATPVCARTRASGEHLSNIT